jgi:hypothetical protein
MAVNARISPTSLAFLKEFGESPSFLSQLREREIQNRELAIKEKIAQGSAEKSDFDIFKGLQEMGSEADTQARMDQARLMTGPPPPPGSPPEAGVEFYRQLYLNMGKAKVDPREVAKTDIPQAFGMWETKGPLATATATASGTQPGSPYLEQLQKSEATTFTEQGKLAQSAAAELNSANEASKLVNKGIITGFGADFITGFGNFLTQTGLYKGDAVSNTQTFAANRAQAVGQLLGSGILGAGTGITEFDVQFAQNMSAGKITITEDSIKRIIELNARVSKNIIKNYNKKASKIPKEAIPYELTIEAPQFKPFLTGKNYSTDNAPPPGEWKYGDLWGNQRYIGGPPNLETSWESMSVWEQ